MTNTDLAQLVKDLKAIFEYASENCALERELRSLASASHSLATLIAVEKSLSE